MAEASAVGMHKYWPWAIGEPGTKVFEAVPTKERPEPSQVGQTLPTDSEFYTDHELKKKGPDGKTVWIPYLCEDSAGQLFQGWVKKRGCKGRSGPPREFPASAGDKNEGAGDAGTLNSREPASHGNTGARGTSGDAHGASGRALKGRASALAEGNASLGGDASLGGGGTSPIGQDEDDDDEDEDDDDEDDDEEVFDEDDDDEDEEDMPGDLERGLDEKHLQDNGQDEWYGQKRWWRNIVRLSNGEMVQHPRPPDHPHYFARVYGELGFSRAECGDITHIMKVINTSSPDGATGTGPDGETLEMGTYYVARGGITPDPDDAPMLAKHLNWDKQPVGDSYLVNCAGVPPKWMERALSPRTLDSSQMKVEKKKGQQGTYRMKYKYLIAVVPARVRAWKITRETHPNVEKTQWGLYEFESVFAPSSASAAPAPALAASSVAASSAADKKRIGGSSASLSASKRLKLSLPEDARAALAAGHVVRGDHRFYQVAENGTHIADVRYKLKCNGKSVQWYLHKHDGTWKHLQLETSNRLLEAA